VNNRRFFALLPLLLLGGIHFVACDSGDAGNNDSTGPSSSTGEAGAEAGSAIGVDGAIDGSVVDYDGGSDVVVDDGTGTSYLDPTKTVVPPPRPDVGTFSKTHDAAAGSATLTLGDLSMTLNYKGGVRLSALTLKGRSLFASAGISFIETSPGAYVVSADPSINGTATETPTSIAIDFAVGPVKENWTFTGSSSGITWALRRQNTGSADLTLPSQGFPRFLWNAGAWDAVRKPADGGNLPLGGLLLPSNTYARAMQSDDHRYVARQGSFAFLDRASTSALIVDRLGKARAGTEFYRRIAADARVLETNWHVSANDFTFTNKNPKGYAGTNPGHFSGFLGKAGDPPSAALPHLFSPVPFAKGETIEHSLVFAPGDWASYYDIGSFAGIDTAAISRVVNDFGRAQMQDRDIGGSSEISFAFPKGASFTNLWNLWVAELMQDASAFASFRAQIRDIRDNLQRADGFVSCCYPYSGDSDYYETTDNLFAYILSIAVLDELAPNDAWLKEMGPSAEKAFDYAEQKLLIKTGLTKDLFGNRKCTKEFFDAHAKNFPTLAPAPQPGPLTTPPAATGCMATFSEWNDQYAIGQVSAWHNVLAYAALDRWAVLEAGPLGNAAKAAHYRQLADALKAKFNLDGSIGGFYSSVYTKTYHYTRDANGNAAKDCYHTVPNGYGLLFDVISNERKQEIGEQMRYALSIYNKWLYPGTNATDCSTSGKDETGGPALMPFPLFENGGAKFVTAVPIGQFAIAANDPGYSLSATRTALTNYMSNGFWGFSNLVPTDLSVNRTVYQEPWMSNNALAVWSVYHDLFGLQPTRAALRVRPYLHPEMVGSKVKYTWRGLYPLSITYSALETWALSSPSSIPVSVEWQKKTPNATYKVMVDGAQAAAVKADANGIVAYAYTLSGSHTFSVAQ